MNNQDIILPDGYTPFKEMIICSNVLINGKVPIMIKGHFPFLVGKGEMPIVWLFVDKDGKDWNPVVESNRSLKNDISVNYSDDGKSVLIIGRNTILIHAIKKSENTVEVDSLDLRPLGFDFHGNKAGIYIGTNLFAHNIFQNVPTMINIG